MAKGVSLLISVLAITFATLPPLCPPDSRPLLQPFTLKEDFQHDSLGQFASYPPAQDVGYEPSLSPVSDYDAPGGRALMRVVRPNRAGQLRFGFIHKTFLVTSDGARLVFTYRLNHADSADRLEIGLAGADGCRYVKHVQASANGWIRTEVFLADFRCADQQPLKTGTAIEAFYVVADIKNADADTTYRFMVDDFALTAASKVRFEVSQPQTKWLESQNTMISAKSFNVGETVSLSVTEPTSLRKIDFRIQNQDGTAVIAGKLYDDGTHGDERARDGRWASSAVYVLRAEDPTGVWTIRFLGETAQGECVSTDVRFVYRGNATSGHPRLYFNAAERETLIGRTRDPKATSLWQKILEDAKSRRGTGDLSNGSRVFEMLDTQHLLPSLLGYFDVLNQARSRIESNATVAYLTNDVEARESAKSALLDVARWSRWEPPWFNAHGQHTYYPAGQLAATVAFGYDLLHEHMTPAERSHIRRALIEKQIIPVYKEYVLDDRVLANTSNWIGHTVGGALIAAAAIAGDTTEEEARGQFDTYLNGLLLKMEAHLAASYLPDGSYGEGISYGEFDLETTAPALEALKRVFGIDYWQRTHVTDSYIYPLYVLSQPVTNSPDMGDSHPPSARTIAPLVAHKKDLTLNWYYEQFPHSSITDFLFLGDSRVVQAPQFATSRIFHQKGNAVLRAGWGKDDPVLLFRAGANFNHNHADQGSFLLSAFGEQLITEAGWSDYYKDPYYAPYFTQAIGHNTLLVDDNPESQTFPDTRQFGALDSYPRITSAIISDFYDTVTSDLSSVYRDRLKRYTRTLVFVKPHYFVVFDDVAANGDPARFDWLLHLPDRARIATSPGLALYVTDRASLAIRTLSPNGASLSVHNGRLPYAIFATTTPKSVPAQPAFLSVENPKSSNATQFLTVLVPARTSVAARTLASGVTSITGTNLIGLRTNRGDERDLVMFRIGASRDSLRFEDWLTDAGAFTITQNGDRLKLFAVQNARSLTRAGRRIFASDNAANIASSYSENSVDVACNSTVAVKLELFVGRRPRRALLGGRETELTYNETDSTVILTIPPGEHQLKIELR